MRAPSILLCIMLLGGCVPAATAVAEVGSLRGVLGRDAGSAPLGQRPPASGGRRELQLGKCEGPSETHYFEVNIRLEPDNRTEFCSVADQILLGHDLNQLLLDYGIGDAGVDTDAVFLAGVCPKPTSVTDPVTGNIRRQLLVRNNGFVWKGGGGCRYCFKDSYDRDRSLMRALKGDISVNWFQETFKPETELLLESGINTRVVQDHARCLGEAPLIDVQLVEVSVKDLDLKCDDGKVITSLDSLSQGDKPLKRNNCNKCVSLDFSKGGDGSAIKKGDWVKDQWKTPHGLMIEASGGYSLDSKARILDTGDAECINVDGSRDFGSPNESCNGGGIGVGKAGEDGKGENCKPLGNVLIVQESNNTVCPNSSVEGGTITFIWDQPVLLSDIGLMDVDESVQRIKIHYADNYFETFGFDGFGDNAVQRVVAGKLNVIKVEIIFSGTGAITEINWCPECRELAPSQPDHYCLFTEDDTYIKAQERIYFEDFEAPGSEKAWKNGKADLKGGLTRYMGSYAQDDKNARTYNQFAVDRAAAGVIFNLDFYEVGSWGLGGSVEVFLDAEMIDLGEFSSITDEGTQQGSTTLGVRWVLSSIDSVIEDQKHHLRIIVPRSTGLYSDGKLRLTLSGVFDDHDMLTQLGWIGKIGYDNIEVTIVHECHEEQIRSAILQSPSGNETMQDKLTVDGAATQSLSSNATEADAAAAPITIAPIFGEPNEVTAAPATMAPVLGQPVEAAVAPSTVAPIAPQDATPGAATQSAEAAAAPITMAPVLGQPIEATVAPSTVAPIATPESSFDLAPMIPVIPREKWQKKGVLNSIYSHAAPLLGHACMVGKYESFCGPKQ